MPLTKRRWLRIGAVVLVVTAGLAWLAAPYVNALALIIDVSGQEVAWRRWLPVQLLAVDHEDLSVPTRHGHVVGRLYRPQDVRASTRTVLVVPGLHAGGVEEPRLDRLAARLAANGTTVLSLPLPELRRFIVTSKSTDVIEDAARWLIEQRALTPSGRIGLIGISFGGGLALVAAGRSSLTGKLDMVVSFGGYGDLPRVLHYVSTGLLPDGTSQPAHDYGTVMFLMNALPHLVPADQVAGLDRAVRKFVDASMIDVAEPARGAELFLEAQELGVALPEPARSVMADVSLRDPSRLGPRLQSLAEAVGGDPAVSPERSPATLARVFLAHGTPDTIIPQTEMPSLAAFLDRAPGRDGMKTEWLLTPGVSHADASTDVTAGEVWRIVRFWKKIFAVP
jgi:dienelactone hydrolase